MKKSGVLRAAASFLLALSLLFCLSPAKAYAAYVPEFLNWEDFADREPLTEEEKLENRRVIAAFLREELDLPDSAVAAVLANIFRESSFDPRSIDENGLYFGLCQWSRTRWMQCFTFCRVNELDRFSVEGQMAFLKSELEGKYEWVYREHLLPAEISEDGAQDAQYAFCQFYEAPTEMDWEQVRRSKLVAEVFWPLVSEGELAPAEGPET